MSRRKTVFHSIGNVFPKSLRSGLGNYIEAAGLNLKPSFMLGSLFVYGLVIGLVFYFLLVLTTSIPYEIYMWLGSMGGLGSALSYILLLIAVLLASWLLIGMVFYAYLLVTADSRKRAIEAVLPDFLQLAAANVRAGLPIEQALWRAATPEFGVLAKEVQLAMKRTFSGEPIGESLDYLANRFNSKFLRRTTNVLKFGIKSGGELGEILERTASDLRQMQIMYKEASASMLMYVIFITFAALIGSPLLFAVSHKLISTLTAVWANVPSLENGAAMGSFHFAPPSITPHDFYVFSVLSVIVTSTFASFILGVIMNGNAKNGLRILPFFLVAGLVLLHAIMWMVDLFFSRFTPM